MDSLLLQSIYKTDAIVPCKKLNSLDVHKKILLMPSWYPNKKVVSGSFFKEQVVFLNSHGFDVKVLMCEYLYTKSYLYQRFKRLLTGQWDSLTTSYLIQEPDAFSFPVILQKNWSVQKKIEIQNRCYLKAFESLLKTGWVPDLIHVQGAFRAGFSARFIASRHNIPYVVIEHSPFKLSVYSHYLSEKIKEVLLDAHKVAGVSQYQKQRMFEDGIEREIEVVWNFMDETIFELKSNLLENDNKFIIATITRPRKAKDVETFFKSIAAFVSQCNDRTKIEVIVVGNIPINGKTLMDTQYYEDIARRLNILDVCTIIPHLSRDKIISLLQRSNVFVSTSIDEPYGIAIREAMLCGTPVISTRSGGPEESINDQTGILVDIGDHVDIAQHLMLLKEGKLQFDKQFTREFIISQSGQKSFLDRMTAFYEKKNSK